MAENDGLDLGCDKGSWWMWMDLGSFRVRADKGMKGEGK